LPSIEGYLSLLGYSKSLLGRVKKHRLLRVDQSDSRQWWKRSNDPDFLEVAKRLIDRGIQSGAVGYLVVSHVRSPDPEISFRATDRSLAADHAVFTPQVALDDRASNFP
jgi:hypothetical protein